MLSLQQCGECKLIVWKLRELCVPLLGWMTICSYSEWKMIVVMEQATKSDLKQKQRAYISFKTPMG